LGCGWGGSRSSGCSGHWGISFQGSENVLRCNSRGRNVEEIIVFRRFLDLSDGKIDGTSKDFK
jgi:hypothetical protein